MCALGYGLNRLFQVALYDSGGRGGVNTAPRHGRTGGRLRGSTVITSVCMAACAANGNNVKVSQNPFHQVGTW